MTSSIPVRVRGGAGTHTSARSASGTHAADNKPLAQLTPSEVRLKMQLDDCERRRKNQLIQAQKVARENEATQKKYKQLFKQHEEMEKNYNLMKEELDQLKRVSEAVYKEYEKLLRRFDVETGAMHKAMQKATDWYKQNRALKRQSAILVQKFLQVSPDSIMELNEENSTPVASDKDDDELDDLRRSVKELSSEAARLQVELNTARLEEFEAQEELVDLISKYESEKCARIRAENELAELQSRTFTLERLASLEAEELVALREKIEEEKETATKMRKEADQAKKERNVLAHQSTLLLADIAGDERLQMLFLDIEGLKAKLEDETNRHSIQVQELQNKIFELQSENRIEVLEEQLKLAESEVEMSHLEEKQSLPEVDVKDSASAAPPLPPPLPPPPPAFRDAPPLQHPITEMANMLGIHKTKQGKPLQRAATLQGSAIDEIIDQIKGGRFQLKATERQREYRHQQETPAAVQEMLQILGTMKRGPKKTVLPALNQN
ncbi:hypothetical protein B566_EDAN001704 [Ephemera danica]|nr:hypothetical protein B566_EDAN001704 [Ephemera danica]